MTPRSLVGMTMGARKRAARFEFMLHTYEIGPVKREALILFAPCDAASHTYKRVWRMYRIGQRLRPCPGCAQCLRCLCGNSAACIGLYEAWTKHQKAEPACNDCCGHGCEDGHCDKVDDICDGSGVLPAKGKVRPCRPK